MEKTKKPIYKRIWFWIIIIIVVVAIFSDSGDNKSTNTSDVNNIANTNISSDVEEKDVYLENSNGKDFFEILCDVGDIPKKDGTNLDEKIVYTSSNANYGIKLETNRKNEIHYISIYTMLKEKNDYENFFLSISRLEYNGSDRNKCFNWIHDNIGKEATTKIGDVNFKIYNGTSGSPVLEVYTDND